MITGSVSSFAYQGTNSHAIAAGFQPEPFTERCPMAWRRRHFWWQIPMVSILEHFLSYTCHDEAIFFEGSIKYNEAYIRHFKIIDTEIICPTFLASAYQRFLLGLIADRDRLGLESNLFHYAPLKYILKTKILFECRLASSKVQISSNHNQVKILSASFVKVFNYREKSSRFKKRSILTVCSKCATKSSSTFLKSDAHLSEPEHTEDIAMDSVIQCALVSNGCHDQQGLVATSAQFLCQNTRSINSRGYCKSKSKDISQAGFHDGTKILDATMGSFYSGAINVDRANIGVPSLLMTPKIFHKRDTIEEDIRQIISGFVEQTGHQMLSSLGLDSISSLEVRELLQHRFSLSLPATIVYDYPSILQISDYIWDLLSSNKPVLEMHYEAVTHAHSNLVGIIAGTEFGPNIRHAKWTSTSIPSEFLKSDDLCRVVPFSRWDIDQFHSTNSHARYESSLKFGCWLENPELFDRVLMRMSEQESLGLDPQCRLLLECCFELTQTTRHRIPGYNRKSVGVYVGCVWSEYNVLIEQYTRDTQTSHLIGNGLHFISGRISYTLGFGGPCMGLNTACSSSLVALHLAKKALDQSEVLCGVSAGSNIMLLPLTSFNLAILGSLSSSGRCKTLDSSADGYGRGEDSGAVVLGTVEYDSESPIGIVLGR
jgi:acyl carrier protein